MFWIGMLLFWITERVRADVIDELAAAIMGGTESPVKGTATSIDHPPDPERRARDGRPPSQWLRSLDAEELGIWLQTIEVPPVGVGGMTMWAHLTRDHSFDPIKICGLTSAEQAKLHSAAHYGY
jgi:hypothetical protein